MDPKARAYLSPASSKSSLGGQRFFQTEMAASVNGKTVFCLNFFPELSGGFKQISGIWTCCDTHKSGFSRKCQIFRIWWNRQWFLAYKNPAKNSFHFPRDFWGIPRFPRNFQDCWTWQKWRKHQKLQNIMFLLNCSPLLACPPSPLT